MQRTVNSISAAITALVLNGMKNMDKLWVVSCSAIDKMIPLLLCGVCFLFGCQSSRTIWSARAPSPDGRIVATAHAVVRNAGLSIISGVDTDVYLNWSKDSRTPALILNLADGSDSSVDTVVQMKWLTPTHLELTYGGNRTVGFQAVKWAGVDVSVRNAALDSGTPK